jgi:hypothetical protein
MGIRASREEVVFSRGERGAGSVKLEGVESADEEEEAEEEEGKEEEEA